MRLSAVLKFGHSDSKMVYCQFKERLNRKYSAHIATSFIYVGACSLTALLGGASAGKDFS